MTYSNTGEAREEIAKYIVSFGYKLKLNPNEPYRISARCINEKHCPFRLLISKDGHNPGLAVKTLVDSHQCFRHFSIPSCTAAILAKYFKERIYKNPTYTVADMKLDVEKILKVNASKAKYKRAME